MNFENIKYFKEKKVLDIKFTHETKGLKNGSMVEFSKTGKNYYLKLEKPYQLDMGNNIEAYIDYLVDGNINYLARLKDESTVEILTYNSSKIAVNLPILLDDKYLTNKKGKRNSIKESVDRLKKSYIINNNKLSSYALLGIKKETEENKKEFILLGEKGGLILERKEKEYFKDKKKLQTEVFVAVKEEEIKNTEEYRYFLIAGKIDFLDDTKNFREEVETTIRIDELKSDSSSYLNVWKNYANIEKESSLKLVKDKGYYNIERAKYDKLKNKKEVFQLTLNKSGEFKEGDTLRLVKINPQKLFANYTDENEAAFFKDIGLDEELVVDKNREGKTLVVRSSGKIEEKDLKDSYLFYSLKGNEAVYNRRERARSLISNDEAAMNGLNLVIEGKKITKGKARNYNALSIQTKKNCFPYDPTETQEKAIEVALNTPDIALIQGPPGTGKTTVITAILQRLSEEKKEVGKVSGSNLITSFQHDAVSNATARIKILGLPAEKYGQKGGTDGQILNKIFKKYINETLKHYYEKNPKIKRRKEEEELLELYSYYDEKVEKAPEKEEVKRLVKKLKSFTIKYSIPQVDKDIKGIEEELEAINKNYSFIEKRFFQKLPTSKKMLEDKGMFFVKKSIKSLEEGIKRKEISLQEFEKELRFLKTFIEDSTLNLKIMKRCKVSILSKLIPIDDPYISRANNKKVEEIFEKLSDFLENLKKENGDYKEDLKVKYARELEDNPLRIRDTLRSYITTFGATCQQSQGKVIKEAKNGNERVKYDKKAALKEYEIYDNVLVDEAARSNPPDLLIPMSMAKDRIILVGDHKQLPHIVDESIVNQLKKDDKSVKSVIDEQVKLSMFQILIEKCLDLEKHDGIKRTVMLDTQYRMHPKMGDFVSEQFYENKLISGLLASKFENKLRGLEGKAFAWLDVPYTKENKEKTRKKSKYRNVEAKEIAKFIYKHIDSEEARGQNFGVITFYAEQREEIFKELANEENRISKDQEVIVEKHKNGYRVIDKYAFSKEKGIDEKLRVGSVDAFQGMEFNFVCLSMVRSNKDLLKNEKDVRGKFGFLTNANRLCVAMSRQKELLIMFGDSKMFEKGNYDDIKPLKEYLKMCKEEGEYGKFKSLL